MFEANGRSFTTPEEYAPSVHINIAKNKPIFVVNKVLSSREWLPLTGNTLPFSLIPGNIIALIKRDLSVEEAVDLISEKADESVIQEILSNTFVTMFVGITRLLVFGILTHILYVADMFAKH